ncbi:hypothetical protein VTJ04DRAFT_7934 [Mycothermus thermophilus]|uniref:uncharacterized protein n=1 Tax=Humicola insolens TaxID=85995 RepID=UPI0037424825
MESQTTNGPAPSHIPGEPDASKPAPLDLSHHYSAVTNRRLPSKIKEAYKFFAIPGIHNLAGGLPNPSYFPFDTLEAQTAKPERWTPTPNHPSSTSSSTSSPSSSSWLPSSSSPSAPRHITVPKSLPIPDPLRRIDLTTALQYGLAQGYPPLLAWVRQFVRQTLFPDHPYSPGPEVILTCGSTDGFAKALNLFVNQWTEGVNDVRDRPGLLCEPFVYTNVLNQARPLGVQVVTVTTDEEGMVPFGKGGLEDVLENWDPAKGMRPRLMYTVTLGQNPTGTITPNHRKHQIYTLCQRYDVIIIEDEPYWYMQFPSAATEEAKARRRQPIPPSPSQQQQQPPSPGKSSGYPFLDSLTPSYLPLDVDGRVVRLDTFSKTVAPGCRLGWITAQPAFIERLERITEATTQQPSGFVQGLVAELILGGGSSQQSQQNTAGWGRFERLSALSSSSSSGWQTAGFVRWLEGLRDQYERRMVRMCRVLEQGRMVVRTKTVKEDLSSLTIVDADSDSDPDSSDYITDPSSEWTPLAVHATPIYTFRWPRAGMFVWIKVAFETHPLWHAPRTRKQQKQQQTTATKPEEPNPPILTGPILSVALTLFLTTAPFRVIVGPGSMFDATGVPSFVASNNNDDDKDGGEQPSGWAYHRLCFAAESDERVDSGAERYVRGMHAFWGIKDVQVIEDLLDGLKGQGVEGQDQGEEGEEFVRLGWFGGC